MGIDKSGGAFVGVLLVVVVVVGGAFLLRELTDSGAARVTQAQANLAQARADERRAETEKVEAKADAFERRYILFATSLAAFTSGFTLADVALLVALAAGALGGGYWLGMRLPRRE